LVEMEQSNGFCKKGVRKEVRACVEITKPCNPTENFLQSAPEAMKDPYGWLCVQEEKTDDSGGWGSRLILDTPGPVEKKKKKRWGSMEKGFPLAEGGRTNCEGGWGGKSVSTIP